MEKAEILKNYYKTDIDPTVDSLNNVITLCENLNCSMLLKCVTGNLFR